MSRGPILVSSTQRGNRLLENLTSWEYSDIASDYVMGTTCALFISLKYHCLHPEYIYNRIVSIKHSYKLRVLLIHMDVENYDAALNELHKTSLVNDIALILCWSLAEAAGYLEDFKSLEFANPNTLQEYASTNPVEQMIDCLVAVKSIHRNDAIALLTEFGCVKNVLNQDEDNMKLIPGLGINKIEKIKKVVDESFVSYSTAFETSDD